jgi:hypothetical protein
MRSNSEAPPKYERAPCGSKLDPFRDEIHRLLKADPRLPGQRVRELIAPLGFDGGKTIVDDYLRGGDVRTAGGGDPRGEGTSLGLVDEAADPSCFVLVSAHDIAAPAPVVLDAHGGHRRRDTRIDPTSWAACC